MYLRRGIVIHSFILSFFQSHGVLFLLVSSAIDVATTGAVGWCSIVECLYVHRTCIVRAMVTADGLRRDAVPADGTHAQRL